MTAKAVVLWPGFGGAGGGQVQGFSRGTAQEEQLWLQADTGLEELHMATAEPKSRHCRAEIQPPKQAPHVGLSPRSDAYDANQVTTTQFVFRNIELVNNKNRKGT